MKNRLKQDFSEKKLLMARFTGGLPSLQETGELMAALERGGADILEIALPFSDPIAEGPALQEANIRALEAGATAGKVLDTLKALGQRAALPVVLYTYLNPVLHQGYEAFFSACDDCGVEAVTILDLPYEEQAELKEIAEAHGVCLLSIIAPSREERLKQVVRDAQGILLLSPPKEGAGRFCQGVKAQSKGPCLALLAENTPAEAARLAEACDGAAITFGVDQQLLQGASLTEIEEYIRQIKGAIQG